MGFKFVNKPLNLFCDRHRSSGHVFNNIAVPPNILKAPCPRLRPLMDVSLVSHGPPLSVRDPDTSIKKCGFEVCEQQWVNFMQRIGSRYIDRSLVALYNEPALSSLNNEAPAQL